MNYKYDYTHNDSDNLTICGMVKFIHEKYPFPSGSMVTWRSNGYDFEFNREYPLMNLTYENDTFLSDNKKYNNISHNTLDPFFYGSNNVESKENSFLFDLICKLYNEENMLV